MKRLIAIVLLAVAGLVASSSVASAAPKPCVRYVDPIHMGSYDYCPLG